MKNYKTLVVYIAVALLCASNAHGAEQPDRPNIVFILADDKY